MDPNIPFDILEYRDGAFSAAEVKAIRELPLRIVVNGQEVISLQCTGMQPRFLVAGYLFGSGLIEHADDIVSMIVTEDTGGIVVCVEIKGTPIKLLGVSLTSGMGRDILTQGQADETSGNPRLANIPVPPKPFIRPANILDMVRALHTRSSLYRLTRGCHNSSLCTPENMLIFRSDIGRHNAIDTIVGQCLMEAIPLQDKMIVSTGRIASEIVHKAVRAGIGVYASIAVATSHAVETAMRYDLTLIGNATEDKFWVYHDPGRLFSKC
ncbi:formate dehydrogenase accessory sulfurtransferase FdhD [Fundidesulfovibrio putealis]|uniref:formate dehydrogenase accessory sulfurtransferase FdhD n=1 Tax=Fundidesulfovibrio putealis TaxID=270496 RepID=UPI000404DE8D|nr:formate dehydrogenase accessory sulfurtransferase FdhD [Fundidesulfovibrio putealis]